MKKETKNLKRVCIVIAIVILGIVSFSLGYYTAPRDDGVIEDDDNGNGNGPNNNETRNETIYLEPIIENAIMDIYLYLEGNAIVIPTFHWEELHFYEGGHNTYIQFYRSGHFVQKEYLLNNFEKVYIGYDCVREKVDDLPFADNESIRTWSRNITFVFFLFAYDNGARFTAELDFYEIHDTLDDRFADFTTTEGIDSFTYTIHYPKIIGWEDP